MIKFLLWCILLVLCWPLALAALLLYPLVWLLLLPFRMVRDRRGRRSGAGKRHHLSSRAAHPGHLKRAPGLDILFDNALA